MNDKLIMESILLLLKSTVEVYVHGTLESSNKKVHDTLKYGLDEIMKMQFATFEKMKEYDYYQITNVDNQTILSTLKNLEK